MTVQSNVVKFPQKTEQTPQEIAEWAKEEYKKATGDEKTVYYQMYLDAMDKIQQIALVFDSYPELTDNQAAPIRSILDHNSGIYCPASHLTCDVLEGWKGKSSPINPKPETESIEPEQEFKTVKSEVKDSFKSRYEQWVMAMIEKGQSEKIISFEDWKAIADFILA